MQHNTTLGSCSTAFDGCSCRSSTMMTKGNERECQKVDKGLSGHFRRFDNVTLISRAKATSLVWESAVRGLTDARDRTVVPFQSPRPPSPHRFHCPSAIIASVCPPRGLVLESCSWAGALEHAMQHMQAVRSSAVHRMASRRIAFPIDANMK
ncbi:hypothetical protein CGRA01v4_03810 [Colletotrichum graminicola]|nr:hypothetical protein CGRA01v4_03810 [Colletotrichum graminicola]